MITPLAEFEKEIQKRFDPRLKIIVNKKGAPEAAGVYLCGYFIGVTLSSQGVYERYNPEFTDNNGVPWRSRRSLYELIPHKIVKFKRDYKNGLYDD